MQIARTVFVVFALLLQFFPVLIQPVRAANLVSDFRQCANEDPTLGDCHWISSIIQQSNSQYFEGMSVPQRVLFTGVQTTIGNVHRLEFSHQATKAGTHAYDWLTSYDQAVAAAALAGVDYNDINDQACDPEIGPPGSLQATCVALRTGGNSINVDVPNDPFVSQHGSTQTRIDAYETQFGNRTIKLYAGSAISAGNLTLTHSVGNGGDTGDSDINYVLTWTSASDKVLIEMAGHLSLTGDGSGASWGAGNGSSQISGGPYHFNLSELDDASLGSQDNQIKGADILPPPPPEDATLTVIKHVVNDNGGTAVAGDFGINVSAVDPSQTEFQGVEAPGTLVTVKPGQYSVTEDAFPGYGGTYSADCTGTVVAGDNKVCTITNDDQPGELIVIKNVINDNGGAATASDFAFQVNNGTQTSFEADGQNNIVVNAGTYSVTEVTEAGYETSYNNCTNLIIPNGGSATCTVTNNDIAPSLTLQKVVNNDNGGTLNANAWTLTATGPTGFSGQGPTVSNGESFDAGSYALSETGPANYAPSAWVCVGGTQQGSSITVGLGESATCVITNDDDAPSLTLIKEVINNNGGSSVATDWTLSANGPTPISGAGGVVSGPTFAAGAYALSETGLTGYAASNWNCAGGTQEGSQITVSIGEDAVCTITNDDIAPRLTLIKTVVNNNGGSAVATDWTLTANGPTPISGAGGTTSGGSFSAGSYNLSESAGAPGYAASDWACVGGTQLGATISLALAQMAACTITNDDIAPTLTLVKVVVNDNGGNAVVSDFPLFVNGQQVTSGVANTLSANTLYTSTETSQLGYAASSWVGDCSSAGTITLQPGENKTCTITNDDIAPRLTLTKVVVNNAGGNAEPNDFNLTVGGSPVLSGATSALNANQPYALNETLLDGYSFVSLNGDEVCPDVLGGSVTLNEGDNVSCTITNDDIAPTLTLVKTVINDNGGTKNVTDFVLRIDGSIVTSGTVNTMTAGVHQASEVNLPGYDASAWGGDCAGEGGVTLALGENKTCTITNNDQAPSLTLRKVVTNNNGGELQPSDWTLTATGPTGFSGPGPEVSNGESFDAGSYALSEAGPTTYNASSWVCVGGTQSGSNISLGLGESATCVITNDDMVPSLTLIKRVLNDNGGTAIADNWTLFAIGPSSISGAGGASSGPDFIAGTYQLSESTGPAGYAPSTWLCLGGSQSDDEITLGLGQNAVCTIVNDDIPGRLIVHKETVPSTNTTTEFSITATGGTVNGSPTQTITGDATVIYSVNVGVYSVSEAPLAGWAMTGNTCANLAIGLDQTAVCTITNTQLGQVSIIKDAQPNDVTNFDFNGSFGAFQLDDDAGVLGANEGELPNQRSFTDLLPAAYTVTEVLPSQFWTLDSISCVDDSTQQPVGNPTVSTASVTVILAAGQRVTCTFVNVKESPTRTQGFWQTHTAFTSTIFAAFFPAGMQIGSGSHKGIISNLQTPGSSQLFGAYFSNIAKKTTGKGNAAQRTALDKARMQLLQQLVTAKLNCAAFGCSTGIQVVIAGSDSAYAGTSISAILVSANLLDAYNNSGDTIIITPYVPGNATPSQSQLLANLAFWDTP